MLFRFHISFFISWFDKKNQNPQTRMQQSNRCWCRCQCCKQVNSVLSKWQTHMRLHCIASNEICQQWMRLCLCVFLCYMCSCIWEVEVFLLPMWKLSIWRQSEDEPKFQLLFLSKRNSKVPWGKTTFLIHCKANLPIVSLSFWTNSMIVRKSENENVVSGKKQAKLMIFEMIHRDESTLKFWRRWTWIRWKKTNVCLTCQNAQVDPA